MKTRSWISATAIRQRRGVEGIYGYRIKGPQGPFNDKRSQARLIPALPLIQPMKVHAGLRRACTPEDPSRYILKEDWEQLWTKILEPAIAGTNDKIRGGKGKGIPNTAAPLSLKLPDGETYGPIYNITNALGDIETLYAMKERQGENEDV